MGRLRIMTAITLGLAAAPAIADGDIPFDDATRSAIQHIITDQLDALDHEDGDKAESFAAQGIRQKFPSGPAFMAMVRERYGALIHPKRTKFGATNASPHGPLQTVTIVAADGTIWTAIYSFEQLDGTWRITGCSLRKIEGKQEI